MKIGNKIGHALLILACAFLLVFALAVPSFAEGDVAKIGDVTYATLEDAIAAVPDGGEILLLADASLTGDKPLAGGNGATIAYYYELIGKNFTLNGGGNKLTVKQNSGLGSYIKFRSGELTLTNITITSEKKASYALFAFMDVLKPYPVLNINEGTVIDSVQGGNGSVVFIQNDNVTVNINGGEIKNCTAASFGTFALFSGASSEINVNGGLISQNTGGNGALFAQSGILTVSDSAEIKNNSLFNIYATSKATVKAGTVAENNRADGIPEEGGVVYADTDKKLAVYYNNVWYLFADFLEALPAGKDSSYSGGVAYLLDDVEINNGNSGDNMKFGMKTFTVEGRGKKVKIASGKHIYPRQGLTIRNLIIEKTASAENDAAITQYGAAAATPSNLTLENVTFENVGTTKGTALYNDNQYATTIAENVIIRGFGRAVRLEKDGTVKLLSGTVTGNSASSASMAAVYVGSGGTLEVGADAMITGNTQFNIYAVKDATVTGTVAGNNKGDGIMANGSVFFSDTDKKIIVYYNNTWFSHTDFLEALPTDSKYNGGIAYLLGDVEINKGNVNNNDLKFGMQTFTVEGRGKTVTIDEEQNILARQKLTLKNLTINKKATKTDSYAIKQNAGSESVPSVVTLVNVTVKSDGGSKMGTGVLLDNAYAILSVKDSSFTGLGYGVRITNGNVDLESADIRENGYGVAFAKGSLNVSGNTVVSDNSPITGSDAGKNRNIFLNQGNGQILTVKNGFTGSFGIHGVPKAALDAAEPLSYAAQGVWFANAESGLTLADSGSIVSDNIDGVFGYIDGTAIKWTKAPSLKIETDKGKYAKDGAVYGVIRALTTSTNDAETPVEYYGTAFVLTDGEVVTVDTPKAQLTENATFGKDKGFIVDMVEEGSGVTLADDKTYTYIPVSYYKIKGIDEVKYIYGTAVSFTKANEKTVEYTD